MSEKTVSIPRYAKVQLENSDIVGPNVPNSDLMQLQKFSRSYSSGVMVTPPLVEDVEITLVVTSYRSGMY